MILVCGGLADGVTELVCARLTQCGDSFRLLDLGRYPEGYRVAWRWSADGPMGAIACSDWSLDLAELTGVYLRFVGPEGRMAPQGVAAEDAAALQAETDSALAALIEDLPCPVVNRLGGGMSNNSKPYQSLLVRRRGLRPPPTLVTNEPAAARDFWDEHRGEVIYKSVSGVRSIVRRLGAGQLARLEMLRDGPAQLQAFIPGRNVRVHVVGEQVFATRVDTDAVDYRYAHLDGLGVAMEPVILPAAVHRACTAVAADLDLLFAGIDLKETPEGEWFCFEVNPCPGFLYYERHTGQPISAALAELLRGGAPARQSEVCDSSTDMRRRIRGRPFDPIPYQ
jgi:glutathione synthase/RimK-type ligase-like ATP-grasp enzyme